MATMRDAIDERLRECARLSALAMDSDEGRRDMKRRAREARRSAVVDMSADAIDARIRECSALSALCGSLELAGIAARTAIARESE
jgi:hypothetical protein